MNCKSNPAFVLKALKLSATLATSLIALGCAAPQQTTTLTPTAPPAKSSSIPTIVEASQEEVLFSELFNQGGLGSSIIIQPPLGKMLVINDGTYNLGGRDLVVYAASSVVRGTVKIRFFMPGVSSILPPALEPATPLPANKFEETGEHGQIGQRGGSGRNAGRIYVDVRTVSFDPGSSLVIDASGELGGPGGTGGMGGKGGPGKPGRDAGELPSCSRPCPDSGTRGGQGGPRGAGGQGGTGGNGGLVYLSPELMRLQLVQGSELSVVVSGGEGGASGNPGKPGVGGDGGPRGSGSSTCICSDPPPPGPQGYSGGEPTEETPPSAKGSPGRVVEIR